MFISKMEDGSVECFLSFQGEGATIGEPCVFVRLAGCSCSCSYCDTAYTWLFQESGAVSSEYFKAVNKNDYVTEIAVDELVQEIKNAAGQVRRVVFTGGEPLLQQDDVIKIMESLGEGWDFEVETNGTIMLKPELISKLSNINCSPKLSSSGNDLDKRDIPEVIKLLVDIKNWDSPKLPKIIFKFVVTKETLEEDMAEIREWQLKYGVQNNQVYLMPEGVEAKRIKKGLVRLLKVCKEEGYKLSPRVQILVYGQKRMT